MKKIFSVFLSLTLILSLVKIGAPTIHAVEEVTPSAEESGVWGSLIGAVNKSLIPVYIAAGTTPTDWYWSDILGNLNVNQYVGGGLSKDAAGNAYSPGVLGIQENMVAMLYKNQISGQEYVADLLNNIGLPTPPHAYAAAGGGYNYMSAFLPFWKASRNLAYSLYIIMFIIVGIMIMLRTKVNAQTIITIQAALPNLLITLILITFSYAIVGFMIDIMYFLIYFVVYLTTTVGIISDPTKLVTNLMSSSAADILFLDRGKLIEAIGRSLKYLLWGLSGGALGNAGKLLSMVSPMTLIVVVAFVIAMAKLVFTLLKSYVMIIVQTVTAPIQILMNALPGSKAFGDWLKKTASYIIPFPVAGIMFLFAAILVGNPTDRNLLPGVILPGGDPNPFGLNLADPLYQNRSTIWMPPFTLTDSALQNQDVLTLIGFLVFLMTPAAVKMAQDWLQVKESPYTAEAFSNAGMGVTAGTIIPKWLIHHQEQETQMRRQAELFGKQRSGVGINAAPTNSQPAPK